MDEINEELTIEKAIERMEEIQEKIQSGEISLNESVKLFEEAAKLYQYISSKLDELENRVKILSKGADGKLEKIPFEEE